MAYNNYQPYQYHPQYMPQNQNNGIIWVQGEAGAKSYLVAPNTTVQLWDSESQTIYLKSADSSGMPTMKILDYTMRDNPVTQTDLSETHVDYATRDEVTSIKEQIDILKEKIEKMDKK